MTSQDSPPTKGKNLLMTPGWNKEVDEETQIY
jgi:hypothetical protein